MSTTGLEMNCGSPMVGWVCIRKPGAALTSQIAPPVSRTGSVMSGQMKSMPAMSSPIIRAASSAISTFSGCASKVRSIEMPPVDMLPVSASLTISPSAGTESSVWPWPASTSSAASSTLIRVSTFSWPTPRRGSALVRSTSSRDRGPAVAGDRGRDPLGDGGHPAVDDQAAVVLAGDERLHDAHPAARLLLGDRERLAHVVVVLQVEADAAAVVAVERLDDDREADPAGRGHGLVGGAHRLLLGHRQPGRAEQLGREVLVGGDVDRDRAGLGGHRGADPLGVDALAELDEGVLVEPDPGDVAADRLVEDRLGRRTERRTLGAEDERLELGLPVELRVGLDEVVDQPDREPAGGEPDVLVDVAVDDVVVARARP